MYHYCNFFGIPENVLITSVPLHQVKCTTFPNIFLINMFDLGYVGLGRNTKMFS